MFTTIPDLTPFRVSPPSVLEIELRIAKKSDVELPKPIWNMMRLILDESGLTKTETESLVEIFSLPGGNALRVVTEGGETRYEVKTKLQYWDQSYPPSQPGERWKYQDTLQLRLAVSEERPASLQEISEISGKTPSHVRRRTRHQYTDNENRCTYDLTIIQENPPRFEVEIEFLPEITSERINAALDRIRWAIETAAASLYVGEAKPENLTPYRVSLLLERDQRQLPAYTVTNKLDGDRVLIASTPSGIYAINNHYAVRVLDRSNRSDATLTILEAEEFKGFYYIFDCMVKSGSCCDNAAHWFQVDPKRRTRIQNAREWASRTGSNSPFRVKEFYGVERTEWLLQQLTRDDNDGLIYTPNGPYLPAFDSPIKIFKWKFPEKMTIDFQVLYIEGNRYRLVLHDGQRPYPFEGTRCYPMRHAVYYSDAPLVNQGIYEFGYDFLKRAFVLFRARENKVLPNYYTVGLSVWNDMCEPFTERDLILHLNDRTKTDGETDDVSKEFKKYKRYHNTIKKELIESTCVDKTVLDIGIGRGGDLLKYSAAKVEHLIGVEPRLENLMECNRRLQGLDLKCSSTLVQAMGQDTDIIRFYLTYPSQTISVPPSVKTLDDRRQLFPLLANDTIPAIQLASTDPMIPHYDSLAMCRTLSNLFSPNKSVLVAQAHVGSLVIQLALSWRGKVTAWEADPGQATRLLRNLAAYPVRVDVAPSIDAISQASPDILWVDVSTSVKDWSTSMGMLDKVARPDAAIVFTFSKRFFDVRKLGEWFIMKGFSSGDVSLYDISDWVLVVTRPPLAKRVAIPRQVEVVASMFSLSFFFFQDSDFNALVETVSASLQEDGVFIGTTIDEKRTRELLESSSGTFSIDKLGHLRWADTGKRLIEIFLKGSILANTTTAAADQGRQVESLVDFDRLVEALQERNIVLEQSEFFKPNSRLSPDQNRLSSLYRTFQFRKRRDHRHRYQRIREMSERGLSLIAFVWRRLSLPEWQEYRPEWESMCRITSLPNEPVIRGEVDFPDRVEFRVIPATRPSLYARFDEAYGQISSPHVPEIYGLVPFHGRESIIVEDRADYDPIEIIERYLGQDDKKLKQLVTSLFYQIYGSLSALTVRGHIRVTPSNREVMRYGEVEVDLVDGWLIQWSLFDQEGFSDMSELYDELEWRYPGFFQRLGMEWVEKASPDMTLSDVMQLREPAPTSSSAAPSPIVVAPKAARAIRGIVNVGNSCYLNSVLQVLANVEAIRESYCPAPPEPRLASSFGEVICEMTTASASPVGSRFILDLRSAMVIKDTDKKYTGTNQEDAAECFNHLVDALYEENCTSAMKKTLTKTIPIDPEETLTAWSNRIWKVRSEGCRYNLMRDLFETQILATLTCKRCGETRYTMSSSWLVDMAVVSQQGKRLTSLREMFSDYAKESEVEIKCQHCGDQNTPHTKKDRIFRFPNVLVIHMSRFQYRGKASEKLTHAIDFPASFKTRDQEEGSADYDLASTIHHSGSAGGGHYTATVKANGDWWKCDDERVNKITPQAVQADKMSPYILLYQRR